MIQHHSCAPSICSLMDALQTVPFTKQALFLGNNVFVGVSGVSFPLCAPFNTLQMRDIAHSFEEEHVEEDRTRFCSVKFNRCVVCPFVVDGTRDAVLDACWEICTAIV